MILSPTLSLEAHLYPEARVLVFSLSGELDLFNVDRVRQELGSYTAEPGSHWIVDLSQISFLDSAGIGLLLRLRKEVYRGRSDMRVVLSAPQVRKVWNELQMGRILPTYSTLQEALI